MEGNSILFGYFFHNLYFNFLNIVYYNQFNIELPPREIKRLKGYYATRIG